MNQRVLLSGLIIFFFYLFALPLANQAQGIVSVNNVTGTANATIPVYTVTAGDIAVPVALNYNASGLKVEDYDYSVGLGWRLIGGASVVREVRGFPDDVEYQGSSTYNVIKGWLKSGNPAPQAVQSLSFANNGTSNCANEISDANTIANNLPYYYDAEPDLFSVSAPGLSCSFVFDASSNHTIKTIPYRDYVITTTNDAAGKITAFTITNENGIKYYFDKPNLLQESIDLSVPGATPPNDPASLEAFRRDFAQYRATFSSSGNPTGAFVTYNDQWGLTKIEDTKGNTITFEYEYFTIQNPIINNKTSHTDIEILKPDGSGNFTKKKLYGITKSSYELRLLSIKSTTIGTDQAIEPRVQFLWNAASGNGPVEEKKLTKINLIREKTSFDLIYTAKFYTNNSVWAGFGRYFLKGLTQYKTNATCDNVYTQFDFTYYGVDEPSHTCYCTPIIPSSSSPADTIINGQDYWGYYNGHFQNHDLNPQLYVYPDNPSVELYKIYPIPGATVIPLNENSNRDVDPQHTADGTLKTITYPTGATALLEYESNQFYDPDVNGNVNGGGIRIQKITNYDGIDNQHPDVVTYSYNEPTNSSLTTGRAISVPKFALAFPNSTSYSNTTDRVKNSTYKTTYDLNKESETVLYGKVTVSKAGIGKSVYEYNTSGTFGGADITDWQESKNYVARTYLSSPTPCTAIAPSFLYNNNAELQYPFTADPNYDFERGMPIKVTHYNTSNQIVASEEYSYARSHTNPTKIYGIKVDEIGTSSSDNVVAYGKYGLNTVVDNFMVTHTSKVYNSNTTNPVTDVETYVYTPQNSGLNYRLLKQVQKQNSDGVIYKSNYTYAREYTTVSSGGDDMNNAIRDFNAANKNVVIETSQERTDGSGTKTMGATINYYKPFTVGFNGTSTKNLPSSTYSFINQAGVSNFTASTINGSGSFVRDNTNYSNPPTVIEKYSNNIVPMLITDESRVPKTLITDLATGIKLAEFANARPEEVCYANFETENPSSIDMISGTGNATVSGGRYSTNCLSFQPNTQLCRTLTKNPNAKGLIISFWLKDAQANGNIYICFSRTGAACGTFTCTSSSYAIPFTASNQWKYYQYILPWGGWVSTTTYSLATSDAVKIDDILIYPDNSNVATYSYTTNNIASNLLTAKTGVNGIGNTYEYDGAGRLWLVRDQFDNIVEMKKYKLANRAADAQIPFIYIGYPVQPILVNTSATFSTSIPSSYETGDCNAPPIVYTWNFGDGGTATSYGSGANGQSTVQHTYTNTGTYQASVTASSPGMNNVVAYTPATNSTNPPPVTVVASPPPCYPGTPQICAAGIIQRTSAGQCIQAYCSPLPSTCNDTYFQVTDITGGTMSSVYSVQWEMGDADGNNWVVYQPETQGLAQTSVHFHPIHTSTYSLRARVRFCNSTGSTATSTYIVVKNGD